jgi:hypothetical protein
MAALEQEAEELQQDEHQLQNEVQQLKPQVFRKWREALGMEDSSGWKKEEEEERT